MTDRKTPDGDYEVGHGRPPKETRWKKGQSGNPKGRPKSKKTGPVDISAFLDEPVTARIQGRTRKMHSFEAMVWQMAQRALMGNLTSIISFIELCEEYDLIHTPEPEYGGGVVTVPRGMTVDEFMEKYTVPIEEE